MDYLDHMATFDCVLHWLCSELSFCNAFIEKPYFKCLNNIDTLLGLLFYYEINRVKTPNAFNGYAKSYMIDIIDSIDK